MRPIALAAIVVWLLVAVGTFIVVSWPLEENFGGPANGGPVETAPGSR